MAGARPQSRPLARSAPVTPRTPRIPVKSFIKTAGGKRRTAPIVVGHVPTPAEAYFDHYYEPFLGGGAVFFALANAGLLSSSMRVHLSDVDKDLATLWSAVHTSPKSLVAGARRFFARGEAREASTRGGYGEVYLEERTRWNRSVHHRTSARQLFLRRTGWNGLWRKNRAGELNTPYRGEPPDFDEDPIFGAHQVLSGLNVDVGGWDFREIHVQPRSLIYLDPPYLTQQRSGRGFTTYTPQGWTEEDMHDLVRLAATWAEADLGVFLSHADDDAGWFRSLIAKHWRAASMQTVMVARPMNRDTGGRGPVRELLVYQVPTRGAVLI